MEPGIDVDELYPICCATIVSAETKTKFLQANHEFLGESAEDTKLMVFVDSINQTYSHPSLVGSGFRPSSPTSPFIGKSAYECHLLLKRLCENTKSAILDPGIFAIVDERSVQDDTVLLVEGDEESGVHTVRASFEVAVCSLMNYFAAGGSAQEDQEEAEKTADGVLRL